MSGKKHILSTKNCFASNKLVGQNVRQNVKQNMLFRWQAQPARPGGATAKCPTNLLAKGYGRIAAKMSDNNVGQNRGTQCSTMHIIQSTVF